MASPAQTAIEAATRTLQRITGVSIVYWRGENSVEIGQATVGATRYELDDGSGTTIRVEARDYIVSAAELLIDAVAIEPRRGDIIRQTIGDTVYVYEVLPLAGEHPYRPSDSGRSRYRIHTKLIDTETA